MKKYIILSLILFVSLSMSVYAQEEGEDTEEVKDTTEVVKLYGPRKGDFTAKINFGRGTYINYGLVVPVSGTSEVDGTAPIPYNTTGGSSAVNMIGAEVAWHFADQWALTLGGGTILSYTPSQVNVPGVNNPLDDSVIVPAYSTVIADERIDIRVTLGAQYYFKTASKKVFPYVGLDVPFGYARRSLFDSSFDFDDQDDPITDYGPRHVEVKSIGAQAVAGVDYYVTPEFFVGASIVPLSYNYAYSSKIPAPGLPALESDNTQTSFFVQPTLSIGFNFGSNDRDGDGILDKNDKCPDEPGIEALEGCPEEEGLGLLDTDGDGVPDEIDLCPFTEGLEVNRGCPDYDDDGVFDLDENDKCPGVPGPRENNGCPWPDTDGDGVLDKDDNCPTVKGPASNDGCPFISDSASDLIDAYAKEILFQTGKATFQAGITDKLDEIATIMNDFPKADFVIEGHTDNTGGVQINQVISDERANAVLDYLISNGNVEARRLTSEGFGKSRPEFDNNTVEGRTLNRRVIIITTNNE